jgi:hypothetical protein
MCPFSATGTVCPPEITSVKIIDCVKNEIHFRAFSI